MNRKFVIPLLLFMLASGLVQAQVKHHKSPTHSRLALSIANGKTVYVQNCLTCHQADGVGVQNMNPPLIKTSYVLGDKTKLIQIVLNGFNEDVEINGQKWSNSMVAHDALKDQEIANVLTYVRNSFGNKASAVTAAQVKVVRAANKK